MVVHWHPRQGITNVCEFCFPRSSKSDEFANVRATPTWRCTDVNVTLEMHCSWNSAACGHRIGLYVCMYVSPRRQPYLSFLRCKNLIYVLASQSCWHEEFSIKVGLKCLFVPTYIRPSTKCFFDFNDMWRVGRGRWVMHDCMQYDPIQGQGHEPFKVGKCFHFQKLSPLPFTMGAGNWPLILKLGQNKI